jgi:hypothetical protein
MIATFLTFNHKNENIFQNQKTGSENYNQKYEYTLSRIFCKNKYPHLERRDLFMHLAAFLGPSVISAPVYLSGLQVLAPFHFMFLGGTNLKDEFTIP